MARTPSRKPPQTRETHWFTAETAAEYAQCQPRTIARLCASGVIDAYRFNGAGPWRIPLQNLEVFLRRRR